MSKYEKLWQYVSNKNLDVLELSFNEINNITNFKLDHSFLTYKKELITFGFAVDKISTKNQTIKFIKIR